MRKRGTGGREKLSEREEEGGIYTLKMSEIEGKKKETEAVIENPRESERRRLIERENDRGGKRHTESQKDE